MKLQCKWNEYIIFHFGCLFLYISFSRVLSPSFLSPILHFLFTFSFFLSFHYYFMPLESKKNIVASEITDNLHLCAFDAVLISSTQNVTHPMNLISFSIWRSNIFGVRFELYGHLKCATNDWINVIPTNWSLYTSFSQTPSLFASINNDFAFNKEIMKIQRKCFEVKFNYYKLNEIIFPATLKFETFVGFVKNFLTDD